jgi:predicted glycosyltransferase
MYGLEPCELAVSSDLASPRLMVYSQDGLGLGHQRRTSLLADEFLTADPGASVLTISDSPVGRFFDTRAGHDYLKLPSVRKIGPGNWSPVTLSMPFAEVLALRKQVIRTAALTYRPDVLLVDHMPHGAMGELVPTLEALEGAPTRVVLGLRDILDAPATVTRRWRLEGAFEAVERHFDDVLVYGSREVFDVGTEYAWPPQLAARLRYCGYVCAPAAAADAREVRRRYLEAHHADELVVAMAGGGADGFPLFEALLRATPYLCDSRRVAVVLVTGPFLPEDERAKLARLAAELPVHLVPVVSDSRSYLAAADLVVAMAGYNTTAEILSLGANALLVPRPGPSAEQQMRAGEFAARGWVRWLPPDGVTPQALALAAAAALDAGRTVVSSGPDLSGRQRAAGHLLNGTSRNHREPSGSDLLPPAAAVAPLPSDARVFGEA